MIRPRPGWLGATSQRSPHLAFIFEAATVGAPIGSLDSLVWRRSSLGSSAIDLRETVRGEVCIADGPNQSALAVDDWDASDDG